MFRHSLRILAPQLVTALFAIISAPSCEDYNCLDTATCAEPDDGDGGARNNGSSNSESNSTRASDEGSTGGESSVPKTQSADSSAPASPSTGAEGVSLESGPGSDSEGTTSPELATSAEPSDTWTADHVTIGDTDQGSSSTGSSASTDTSEGATATSGDEPTSDGSSSEGETSDSPSESCGDGIRQQTEACDDGNLASDDGCDDCAIVDGWRCSGGVGGASECLDIDECNEGTHTCDANATCADLDGSFECECNDGYSGSGYSCENVDECDNANLNDCHADALCDDTDGSFTCECKPGFDGDGKTCTEEPHVTKLSIGTQMCALISDGRIFCWGGWALGNGPNDNNYQPVPTEVSGITDAIDVTVGGTTVCAILANKTVKCWGSDESGQASGSGASSSRVYIPTTVSGLNNVMAVSNTVWTTCAMLSNGTVRCFGSGSGSGGNPTATRLMTSLSNTTQLSTPVGAELCAVASDGTVKCWSGAAATPASVAGLSGVTQVAGRCALLDGGSVKCWGPGSEGQIGNGSYDDQTTPQLVQGLGTATRLAAGTVHVCALLSDQSVSCWGKDGFFSPIDYGNLPLSISGLGQVVGVFAGVDNSCAIEVDHTVKCWGSNLGGQLGEDREGNEMSPVVVHGLPGSE